MAAHPIEWNNLNQIVLDEFPVLREPRYSKLIGGFEGWEPGQYIVFGSLFNRYIEEKASGTNEAEKSSVGEFLERLAKARDGNIDDLLKLEVLPTLLRDQKTLEAYWTYLGEATRRILELIAPRLAPSVRLPIGK